MPRAGTVRRSCTCGGILFLFLSTVAAGCSEPPVVDRTLSAEVPVVFAKEAPRPLQTVSWTVRCRASWGRSCEGAPVLSFPEEQEYCRHHYQITEGPSGDTQQRVTIHSADAIAVRILASGGPLWNPYTSKISIKIRGWAVPKGLAPEIRAAQGCARETEFPPG